jgi:ketosteroid isomerase-like protein
MGIDENKRRVLAWVAAVNSGDEQAILGMLSDDFIFKMMARSPKWLRYRWNRQEFAVASKAQSTLLTDPIHLEVVGLFGEGDRVVLEMQTDVILKNGKHYDNAYSVIFEFKGGKICQVREYSCSHLVVECFGEFDPNNPQASSAGTGPSKK